MSDFAAVKERIRVRDVDAAAANRLASELSVPPAVARVLVGRGLVTFDQCKRFFRPEIAHCHDPFLFPDMDKAVDRILRAIKDRERITIYGDYDVDGVTSTAMLLRFLGGLGALCDYYLPNRLTEGYGISAEGIAAIAQRGTRLIISVDCGIGACDPVRRARAAGIDVIITDHHEVKEELPDALALINPRIPGCPYPDQLLAGVGVALKVCHALSVRSGSADRWMEYLDLAAVGTAADIVPLTGENRVIAAAGFGQLSATRNIGLRSLIELRGLGGKPMTTSPVVFQLAPCINAVGRLGDSARGVELLITDDRTLARQYAQQLVAANEERRILDARVQEEAFAWIGEHCRAQADYAIVAGHANWHCGVIGIAASKVVEKFHRPAVLFSIDETGKARGSGRSIRGFHLLDALHECRSLLDHYGGHAAAAGVTMDAANLDAFRGRFNEVAASRLTSDDLFPTVVADVEVAMPDLTPKLVRILKQMEPFGPGNMRPVLLCRGLRHRGQPRKVGRGHLKMVFTDGGGTMDAIAFNYGDRLEEIGSAGNLSVAFSLEENEWQGRTNLQMRVKGVAV